jgi:hypothetical protein
VQAAYQITGVAHSGQQVMLQQAQSPQKYFNHAIANKRRMSGSAASRAAVVLPGGGGDGHDSLCVRPAMIVPRDCLHIIVKVRLMYDLLNYRELLTHLERQPCVLGLQLVRLSKQLLVRSCHVS